MSKTASDTGGAAGVLGFVAGHGADVFQRCARCGDTSPVRPFVLSSYDELSYLSKIVSMYA